MFKKIITAFICAATVAGSAITADVYNVSPITVTANAAEAEMTASQIRQTIDAMAAGYYGTKYKVGCTYSGHYNGTSYVTSPPESAPFTHYTHWSSSSCECMGFAKDVFDKIFQSSRAYQYNYNSSCGLTPLEWLKQNVRTGDYIRFGGHSAIVYQVHSDGLTLYDSNAGNPRLTNRFSKVGWTYGNSTHYSIKYHTNTVGGKLYIVRSSKAMNDDQPSVSFTGKISERVDEYLVLHCTPDTKNSSKIGLVPENAEVTVYPDATVGNFFYIDYNGTRGYVWSSYVDRVNDGSDSGNINIRTGTVINIKSNSALAINPEPRKGNHIGTMRNGSICQVDLSRSTKDWYYVTYGNLSGYSWKAYIRVS